MRILSILAPVFNESKVKAPFYLLIIEYDPHSVA
jgi:hypothetical protein